MLSNGRGFERTRNATFGGHSRCSRSFSEVGSVTSVKCCNPFGLPSEKGGTVMPSLQMPPALFIATACIVIVPSTSLCSPDRTAVAVRRQLAAQQKERPTASPTKELTYKVPKGWRVVEATQLLTAKFQIGQGEQTGTVTITALPAPAGGLAANINRWRAQVGLDPLKEQEAEKAARETKVDGFRGHGVDLTGPQKDGQAAQRILAAVVTRGDQVWFFKLIGPADLVGKEKSAFEGFLNSVRFRRP